MRPWCRAVATCCRPPRRTRPLTRSAPRSAEGSLLLLHLHELEYRRRLAWRPPPKGLDRPTRRPALVELPACFRLPFRHPPTGALACQDEPNLRIVHRLIRRPPLDPDERSAPDEGHRHRLRRLGRRTDEGCATGQHHLARGEALHEGYRIVPFHPRDGI